MDGVGIPLATPFDDDGALDERALEDLVEWVTDRGVDFIVPVGSNSESELMTAAERARVVEVVVDATDAPVLAGTGHPGFVETREATQRAAEAGADAALVVTPFYFSHEQEALEAYYRDLADVAEIPIYLYSVPGYTGVTLSPAVAGRLAAHPNVGGMKDSSGALEPFMQTRELTRDADFDLFMGNGSMLATALDAGAEGGINAVANVAPEVASEVYRLHRAGDDDAARALNRDLVELNRAVTKEHGVPGLKAAMRARGAPAGTVRRPHRPADETTRERVETLVEAVESKIDALAD
ncbi:MAG: dihydrodipicolinate synthase family protein [Halobacteriota archaeon]